MCELDNKDPAKDIRYATATDIAAIDAAKASGYGRLGGKAGIAEFTELRWITIETGPQHYPI